jgi:hypothetical protein
MFVYLKALFKSFGCMFRRWPRHVEKRMAPVAELLKQNKYKRAGEEIAYISLDLCAQLESAKMKPKQADVYFTYLLDIMDLSVVPLQKEVKALILEGNVLRDYGKKFGADLNRMRELANTIIGDQNRTIEHLC